MHSLIVPLTETKAADANRFGPKAANLAALGQAGLPIPDGFCLDAEAYRRQIAALGLHGAMANINSHEPGRARRAALDMKLGLLDQPIIAEILDPLLAAWRDLVRRTGARTVVRSSALVEDRFGSSFAGQFESYLGLETEEEFVTAVRSCWAALWSTRVLRYMAGHDASPAETAMAVLIQPLIEARVAGGDSASRTAATWCSTHLGPGIIDRPGRGRTRAHRADPRRTASRYRARPKISPRQLRAQWTPARASIVLAAVP